MKTLIADTVTSLLVAMSLGCQQLDYGLATSVEATCIARDSNRLFFNGVLQDGAQTTEARSHGFADLLSASAQPSLSCGDQPEEAYRLVYAHRPDSLIILAAQNGGDHQLSVSLIRNIDKKLVQRSDRALDEADWQLLIEAIEQFDTWSRTPYPSAAGSTHRNTVLHGSAWILEARKDGRYHALSRASNAREHDLDSVARTFFALARVELPPEFSVHR